MAMKCYSRAIAGGGAYIDTTAAGGGVSTTTAAGGGDFISTTLLMGTKLLVDGGGTVTWVESGTHDHLLTLHGHNISVQKEDCGCLPYPPVSGVSARTYCGSIR